MKERDRRSEARPARGLLSAVPEGVVEHRRVGIPGSSSASNTFLFDAANAKQADVVRAAPAPPATVQFERVKSMKVDAKRGYGLGSSVD